MASPNDLGTLVIVVLKARNLRDRHTFTKQDPFTSVQLGKVTKKTEIDKRGGQHPVWDQDLHLNVPAAVSKESRTLKVSCFSKEPKEDELIGAGEVDITETLQTGEFDDWVKLEDNGQYRGEVYLEMTFFAAGPKPLARRASKMPASERLWRPPPSSSHSPPKPAPQQIPPPSLQSGRPPPAATSTSPKQTHLVPPRSSRTPSPSSKLDALPPLPEEAFQPGGRVDPRLVQQKPTPPPPAAIPAILKPGGGRSPSRSPPSHPATLSPHIPPQAVSQPPEYVPPRTNYGPSPHTNQTIPAQRYNPTFSYNPPSSSYPPPVAPANFAPIAFPEPRVQSYNPAPAPQSTPIYPDYIPGTGGELDASERERLARRYGSPLPAPGGQSIDNARTPPPYQASTPSGSYTSRPVVSSPPPSHPSVAPPPDTSRGPDPDPYLEREREVLSRANQEEADAEFARSLAQEEGVNLEQLKREEADRELARKLARELNAPIIENERRRSTHTGEAETSRQHIPGEWNNRGR